MKVELHNKLNTKQKSVVILVKSMGIIGIDLLQVSEQINNFRANLFFNSLKRAGSSNEVKKIIIKKFSKILRDEHIEFINTSYINRMIRFDSNKSSQLVDFGSILYDCKRISDYFLLSKLLSRLGLFSYANLIEDITINCVLNNDFYSFYSLFQKLKITMYYDSESLLALIDQLRLSKHVNSFLKLNKMLEFFSNVEIERKKLTILGPLREMDLVKNHVGNIAIIKPNSDELDYICNQSINLYYTYTSRPHKNLNNLQNNFYNVVDIIKDKKTDFSGSDNLELIDKYLLRYLINGYPQHLQRLLLHQIHQGKFNQFGLHYFTFYLSDKLYSDNYSKNRFNNSFSSSIEEINNFVWGIGWHDLLANFRFIKILHKQGALKNNSVEITNLLRMSVKDYANKLEKIYNTVS
jgi:hypothetical protein